MLDLLWLIPGLPLGGALLLLVADALPKRLVAAVGVGSVGAAALIVGLVGMDWIARGAEPSGYRQVLWTWIDVDGFTPIVALYLDSISLVMVSVVTGVGFVIHLYAFDYMRSEDPPEYQRFFGYMNLFVAMMLLLVLADDLLVLFVGWEGVGLCSYLLIGFWYQDAANGAAGRKAFIVLRIGDTAFLIGLLLLYVHLGTLNIQDLMIRASAQWQMGDALAIAAAALLLGGALGKSAQIPLQVWLPDAMVGPTPVSALLHAATMVTAGMYVIARTHVLFELAPPVQTAVAAIGAATLLLSGLSALVQKDIKRVLAFSTISQIGYMFLALGVGATSAALFHFMTHAFFKALLFLAAGVVVLSLHHEQDLFKMGGLRRDLPVVFWCMLIGAGSLAGVPLITAGSFSKDRILWEVWSSPMGGPWLWGAGLIGVGLTSLYSFRLIFLAFFGERKTVPTPKGGAALLFPLIVLAVLSIGAGWMGWPEITGPVHEEHESARQELLMAGIVGAVSLTGIALAYLLFMYRPRVVESLIATEPVQEVRMVLARGPFNLVYDRLVVRPFLWAARSTRTDPFDRAYERLIAQPFVWFAERNQQDLVNRFYDAVAGISEWLHEGLHRLQTGSVRWYAAVLAGGSIVLIGWVLVAGMMRG